MYGFPPTCKASTWSQSSTSLLAWIFVWGPDVASGKLLRWRYGRWNQYHLWWMLYTENHVEIFNHWKDVEMENWKYVLLLFRWWLNIYSTSSSAYDVLPALLYTEWGEQSTAKQIHWRQANTWCVVKKHVASNTNYRWLTNPCKNM